MVHPAGDIKKIIYLFDNNTNATKEIMATISVPTPLGDNPHSDHYCYVTIETLLSPKKKLIGVDAFHTLLLAVKFIEKFLSADHKGYEVRNQDGTKYVTPYPT